MDIGNLKYEDDACMGKEFFMNNRRIGKLIITGIVAALSAISGFVAVKMAKTAKKETK